MDVVPPIVKAIAPPAVRPIVHATVPVVAPPVVAPPVVAPPVKSVAPPPPTVPVAPVVAPAPTVVAPPPTVVAPVVTVPVVVAPPPTVVAPAPTVVTPAPTVPVAAPVVVAPPPTVPVAAPVVALAPTVVAPAPTVPVAAPVVTPAPTVPVAAPVVTPAPTVVAPPPAPTVPVAAQPPAVVAPVVAPVVPPPVVPVVVPVAPIAVSPAPTLPSPQSLVDEPTPAVVVPPSPVVKTVPAPVASQVKIVTPGLVPTPVKTVKPASPIIVTPEQAPPGPMQHAPHAPHAAVLSDTEIRKEMEAGRIVMHSPGVDCSSQVQNCSVDITLGEHFFRSSDHMSIFNPFNVNHVREYWGEPLEARTITAGDVTNGNSHTVGLKLDDRYIVVNPGETILAHTREFIGGRHHITTMLRARSSMGRANITICRDAGWGDVGYINRWALQITNHNNMPVVLPVGARVGQVIFLYTGVPSAEYQGNYQAAWDIKSLVSGWTPMALLPH